MAESVRLQVVEVLMRQGGEEALNSLVQHFRAAFVEATNPQFLPPFWQVDHMCAHSPFVHKPACIHAGGTMQELNLACLGALQCCAAVWGVFHLP